MSVSQTKRIFIGEPNDVTMTGFRLASTGAYDNAATMTAQLKSVSGTSIGDAVTMSYETDSDGDYRGTLPSTTTSSSNLTANTKYYVYITSANKTVRRIECVAVQREET